MVHDQEGGRATPKHPQYILFDVSLKRVDVGGIGSQDSLVLLDASGNALGGEEVKPLLDLHRLEVLSLADNALRSVSSVRFSLSFS